MKGAKACEGTQTAMENKIVCDYCGTIYSAEKSVCPLCGNAPDEESRTRQRTPQRRRITEEERRRRNREAARKGKNGSAPVDVKMIPKKLLTASVVFLALAVLVVFYFIGDMLGWWPGLGGMLNSDLRAQDSTDVSASKSCTYLELLPESITFTEKGQIQKLRVIINAGCEETVTFTSSDDKVINVSTEDQKTETEAEQTAITVEVTALAEGSASIEVACGTRTRTCRITCEFGNSASESAPGSEPTTAFEPKLNYEDVTLNLLRETLTLKVLNLPEGQTVKWTSSDETVAEVDENGKVTALGEGTAEITAEIGASKAVAVIRCAFDETTENGNHLTHTDVTISIGEEFNLRLIDGNGDRINDATYYIEDPDICSVSGVTVRGLSRGTTEVTVRYNGQSYTCIVRVG